MDSSPLDLVKAGRWEQVFFTTYALSLSFFEGVILDALVRGGNREASILADVSGVQSALSERGARRAGRDYEVEPVQVASGCFHPKVSVLANADDVHVLVGSGNLTFGGWGNNLEVVEHLHPSFSPDAIRDVADFFEQIATTPRLKHAAADRCGSLADELRRRVRHEQGDGQVRVVHSLEGSIAERIEELASDLGPIEKILVASPFWDMSGSGIDKLCSRFGVDNVHVHAHPAGTVRSTQGNAWPWTSSTKIEPVSIRYLTDGGADRSLHAKAYELRFARGRLVVSGSANATFAALGPDRNVEACVVRIQRDRKTFWAHDPSSAPERDEDLEEEEADAAEVVGVLRATLEGDHLRGIVLTGLSAGTAIASLVGSQDGRNIGILAVGKDGSFVIRAKGLEIDAWNAGRAILRLEDDEGRRAEGFVSLVAISGMIRRIGTIGRSLMSIISMNGTPDDIAAMMEWLHDNPDRYPRVEAAATATGPAADRPETRSLVISDILNETEPEHDGTEGRVDAEAQSAIRFVQMLLTAIRTPARRNASRTDEYVSDDDAVSEDADAPPDPDDPARFRAFEYFEEVFAAMLEKERQDFLHAALELMLFVSDRLEPQVDRIRGWMIRIEQCTTSHGFPAEGRASLLAGIVAIAAATDASPVTTRGRLLKLGVDPEGTGVDFEAVPAISHIIGGTDPEAYLLRVRSCFSLPEQNSSYLRQLRGMPAGGDYPDLQADPELWPVLGKGLSAGPGWNRALEARPRSISCPRCNVALPTAEARRLQGRYAARALNCCGRIVLRTEP